MLFFSTVIPERLQDILCMAGKGTYQPAGKGMDEIYPLVPVLVLMEY